MAVKLNGGKIKTSLTFIKPMRINITCCYLLLLLTVCSLSCKKDIDRKLVGTYTGTARYTIGTASNPLQDRDTLYTNVIITITEGSESTRKETLLNLAATPSAIAPPYRENMPVNNGGVDFLRTNRGAVGSYYKWKGTITSDSLILTNRNEEGNGSVWQWIFKAEKQ